MHIPDEKIAEIRAAVDIVDVVGEVVELKKKGIDFFGLCPFHAEKTPSFSVSPVKQMFYCFGCGAGGDVVEFMIRVTGRPFSDVIKSLAGRAGIGLLESYLYDKTYQYRTPRAPGIPGEKRQAVKPAPQKDEKQSDPAPGVWVEHAEKLVSWAHEKLLENDEQLAWLAGRGINGEAVEKFRLGWNPGKDGRDLWRPRESWGLPTVMRENKKGKSVKKKLWIPQGLIIPFFEEDQQAGKPAPQRIRIRRIEGEPRFFILPGSVMDMMILGEDERSYLVVESELDGIMCHMLAGDMCSVVALGSSSAKPDEKIMEKLRNSAVILLGLDYDAPGRKAMKWWKEEFHQVKIWPVPDGGDPGEAYQSGVDIRQWIWAGLPAGLQLRGPDRRVGLSLLNDKKKGGEKTEIVDLESPVVCEESESWDYIAELAGLLRAHPVAIHNMPDRTYIAASVKWQQQNYEIYRRISALVFQNPEVFRFVSAHPASKIIGENINTDC